MYMVLKWLLYAIFLNILVRHFVSVEAQSACTSNDTHTSLGLTNLDTLFSSLSSNLKNDAVFYNTSVGFFPDRSYGSVLCRADIQPHECQACIRNATAEITRSCPSRRQAITWNELCTLRYSDRAMFGILATIPGSVRPSKSAIANPQLFNASLLRLLNVLRVYMTGGSSLRMAAVGSVNVSDSVSVYSLLQCTPDLNTTNCDTCLTLATSDARELCNSSSCRVLKPSCFLRYEVEPFYNETRVQELLLTPAAPPPFGTTPPWSQPPEAGKSTPPPPLLSRGKKEENKTRIIVIIIVVAVVVIFSLLVGGIGIRYCKNTKKKSSIDDSMREMVTPESLQYEFEEIKTATNGFSDANKLGHGGFGAVYWGTLANGVQIAVKRLSWDSVQGEMEFKNEVTLVARLQHVNLVKLLGFSIQASERLLLYEFVENVSLDRFLFDPIKRLELDWGKRCNIAMGIAKGLAYLHEDSRLKIIHRDIKSGNVLLDKDMNPKIADFGTARLFMPNETHFSTAKIVGTCGYMAPEYATHGHFSVKSDVFSFGVLLLEIVSGQRNNTVRNGINTNLLSYAWTCWHQGTSQDIIDPLLKANTGIFLDTSRCIHIGLLCAQENPSSRPTMGSTVVMLSSPSIPLPMPIKPLFMTSRVLDNGMTSSSGAQSSLYYSALN